MKFSFLWWIMSEMLSIPVMFRRDFEGQRIGRFKMVLRILRCTLSASGSQFDIVHSHRVT